MDLNIVWRSGSQFMEQNPNMCLLWMPNIVVHLADPPRVDQSGVKIQHRFCIASRQAWSVPTG